MSNERNVIQTKIFPASILVIDDEPVILHLLEALLKARGYEVIAINGSELALSYLQSNLPDLILLDISMPNISGYDLCTQLKADQRTKRIPVIFISALMEGFNKAEAFEVGAADYITKPFELEEVAARVKHQLAIANLQKALIGKNRELNEAVQKRLVAEQEVRALNTRLEKRVSERTYALEQEIKKHKETQEKLLYLAHYDPVSQLPNRNFLLENLDNVMNNSEAMFALIICEVHRLKSMQDLIGEPGSSQLLQEVIKSLKSNLYKETILANLSEDHFGILLKDLNKPSQIRSIVKDVFKSLSTPFQIDQYQVSLSASIGISTSAIGYTYGQDILRDASTALNRAKIQGQGHYAIFGKPLQAKNLNRLTLEKDLRRAINSCREGKCSNLYVYYQPIFSVANKQIYGFEALVRWQHPGQGFISPTIFISLAEETGLINDLGWWVLEESCKKVKSWQKLFQKELVINVNLSPVQLRHINCLQNIKNILKKTQLKASSLKLEVTESSLFDNLLEQTNLLQKIRTEGVRLCIDDFGTGYSSLSRLHEFPIDTLKIDKAFIERIQNSTSEVPTVQMIVALAHSLGMEVVAEGIETSFQLEKLHSLNCDLGQGYFFSKPLTAKVTEEFLKRHFGDNTPLQKTKVLTPAAAYSVIK